MKDTMTKTDARMREEMIPSLVSLLEIPSVTERGEGGYPYGSDPSRASAHESDEVRFGSRGIAFVMKRW